jgi:sec-independent protein translocase protein TatC
MSQTTTLPPTSHKSTTARKQLTLIDHLHELRTRLFWIVLSLIVASSASYFIQDQIMAVIMQPLGGQKLVYLTPIGGFNFIFKVSIYFGILLVLPVVIYHIYRFLEPLMQKQRKRSVAFYILASFLLAIGGGCFAYFGSLPAALRFLTSFDIQNVSAMLTVDAYLSFIITYVLGFAALFQIPLILMIANTIKPLPPKKLMGFQRYVILIAFILAAVISPTPDVTNQTILAVPIILMYQVGVFMVWVQSRSARRRQTKLDKTLNLADTFVRTAPAPARVSPATTATPAVTVPAAQPARALPTQPARRARPVMDIARPTTASRPAPVLRTQRVAGGDIVRRAPAPRPLPRQQQVARPNTIDGVIRRQQLPQPS